MMTLYKYVGEVTVCGGTLWLRMYLHESHLLDNCLVFASALAVTVIVLAVHLVRTCMMIVNFD